MKNNLLYLSVTNELLVIINIKSIESFDMCCKKTTIFCGKLGVIVLGGACFYKVVIVVREIMVIKARRFEFIHTENNDEITWKMYGAQAFSLHFISSLKACTPLWLAES